MENNTKSSFIIIPNDEVTPDQQKEYADFKNMWFKNAEDGKVFSTCQLCGLSFNNNDKDLKVCRSHSVPQSILQNVLGTGEKTFKVPVYQSRTKGKGYEKKMVQKSIKKNAGIFFSIHCRCDNNYFSKYYEQHLDRLQDATMSISIYLKNLLNNEYLFEYERYFYKKVINQISTYIQNLQTDMLQNKKGIEAINIAHEYYDNKPVVLESENSVNNSAFINHSYSSNIDPRNMTATQLGAFYIDIINTLLGNKPLLNDFFRKLNDNKTEFEQKLNDLYDEKRLSEERLYFFTNQVNVIQIKCDYIQHEIVKYRKLLDWDMNHSKRFLYSSRKSLYFLSHKKELFQTIFYKKLDYVVPLCFQDSISMFCDFEGNIINPIISSNNMDSVNLDKETCDINICIFPRKSDTLIYLFAKEKNCNTKLKPFIKHFEQLSFDSKLSLINYIIMLYGNNDRIFFTPQINDPFKNTFLKNILEQSEIYIDVNNDMKKATQEYINKYRLDKFSVENIPNYLSNKYKLKEIEYK